MKKNKQFILSATFLFFAASLYAAKWGFDVFLSDDPRPNIILIVTDDQDSDSLNHMPKLNSLLAGRGVTFTQTFVTSPACIPSRASILTGLYLHNHDIYGKSGEFAERGFENRTIATMLREAGYVTGMVGKYFNGNLKPVEPPPGWSEWYGILTDNVYYRYKLNENGKEIYYGENPEDYISKVISRKAVTFIKKRSGGRPFFLYVGTVAPHVPVVPDAAYADSLADIEIRFAFETDLSDKPGWVRAYYEANKGLDLPYFDFNATDTVKAQKWKRNALRTLLSVDDMLEAIVGQLKDEGEYGNTYIFYLSDNGAGLTHHIQTSAKLAPYEQGISVPFLVSGPGIPAGRRLDHIVSPIDLLPTFAELAKVDPPPGIDGRSLLPLLQETSPPVSEWRQDVVVELGPVLIWPWKSTPPMYRLLRARQFKYIEYVTGEREYYDLVNDPKELRNIYVELDAARKKELSDRLAALTPWQAWDEAVKSVPGRN